MLYMANMNQIITVNENTLWLGSLKAAKDVSTLHQHGIQTVITIINSNQISFAKNDNIIHHHFSVPDIPSYKINTIFEQTTNIIKDSLLRGSVLVHCVAGISRSATIVIAYLMKSRGWGYEKAYCYVKERRNINPNAGFRKQLIAYSRDLQIQLRQQPQLNFQFSRSKLGTTDIDSPRSTLNSCRSELRIKSSSHANESEQLKCTQRLREQYLKMISIQLNQFKENSSVQQKSNAELKLKQLAIFDPEFQSPRDKAISLKSDRAVPKHNAAALYKSYYQN